MGGVLDNGFVCWEVDTPLTFCVVFLCYGKQREEVHREDCIALKSNFFFYFEAYIYLGIQSRLESNLRSSCLSLLSAEITGM